MKNQTASFIISAQGRTALEELASDPSALLPNRELTTLDRLRRRYSPEEAAALLEVALSRQRAIRQAKFSQASAMFFTRNGLEQSSGEAVADYRAARLSRVLPPGTTLADLGCGIGGDSLALARYFHVTGVDLDEARLVFAQANLAVYNRTENFRPLLANLTQLNLADYQALFFDPARRTSEGKRLFSVEDYKPPLAVIHQWLPQVQEIGVKISPGVDYRQLDAYECEIETISDKGEVKEAVLWFGGLRSKEVRHRATLLPGGDTLINLPPAEKPPVPSGLPLAYLYEPDGAVIRAGLVEELALELGGLRKLDPEIAYLTSEARLETPFARTFRIDESLPFNLKKLNRRLQELQVGRVTIKKRGSPLDPQQLEHALKLKGDQHLTLVLTHVLGKHTVLLCDSSMKLNF
ncbi:MAG: SAM-dependent methyltransferase [Chloroflexi bacterium]|nr:SAM-dependent methyltransferase [Chloroflexota bacterium]